MTEDAHPLPLPARERTRALFAELASAAGTDRAASLRAELIESHLPLVEYCARRFRYRGEPYEDLVQAGTIGLIKAVDRFDPEHGAAFSSYATPTILGEIKRHFRDKGWAIRVPRRLQELRMSVLSATSELTQSLGRSPTPRELADRLEVGLEEVLAALESTTAYQTLSLDSDVDDADRPSWWDSLGSEDDALRNIEVRESLRPLIAQLPLREQQILVLRYYREQTQSQIAEQVGISQMHVSRLLRRSLESLRGTIE